MTQNSSSLPDKPSTEDSTGDGALAISQGWLQTIRACSSPNFNQRPDGADISLLVIHNISLPPGQFGGPYIEQLFTNTLDCQAHAKFDSLQGVKVSAHLLIQRTGEIVQFVSMEQRAWHAGVSVFKGRENCNDFSIGIELEGTDYQPYTDQQYQQLVRVSRAIMNSYPGITGDRICGHQDIAPGRKSDPGPAFDWQRYRQLLNENT